MIRRQGIFCPQRKHNKMTDKEWEEKIKEMAPYLLDLYYRSAASGYGELHVFFNKENCRIDIDSGSRFRDPEAYKRFFDKGEGR